MNTLKKKNGKFYANGMEFHTFKDALKSIWYAGKEKSCQNCADRYVGCHSECEYYLKRKKARDELNEKIKYQKSLYYYFQSRKR